jgi:hypothetical protein
MRPFDRDVDGVGTLVGFHPSRIGYESDDYDKLFVGRVYDLHDDKISQIDLEKGQPRENLWYSKEDSWIVFNNRAEANKVRVFNVEKDGIGTRVAVSGWPLPDGNDDKKFYYGTIREIDGTTNNDGVLGIEFDEYIGGHSLEGKAEKGHGWNVNKNRVVILSEDFELNKPKGAGAGWVGALKSLMAELLLTNLSKTNSNRVNVVIEDLKSNVGEDWEAEVRKSIEPVEAAEIFISLIKELEKQEQERLQFGSVQTPSVPTTSRRGRPRKDKTPEPKPMPTTPEVDDVQSEEDLSALLDDLLNL